MTKEVKQIQSKINTWIETLSKEKEQAEGNDYKVYQEVTIEVEILEAVQIMINNLFTEKKND